MANTKSVAIENGADYALRIDEENGNRFSEHEMYLIGAAFAAGQLSKTTTQ